MVWSFMSPAASSVPRSRWFRLPLLLVRSRLALVLVVPRSGGFVCPQCWLAFSVGLRSVLLVLRMRWFRGV